MVEKILRRYRRTTRMREESWVPIGYNFIQSCQDFVDLESFHCNRGFATRHDSVDRRFSACVIGGEFFLRMQGHVIDGEEACEA